MLKTWNIKFNLDKVDAKLIRGRAILCSKEMNLLKQEGVSQIIDLREKYDPMRFVEKILCLIYKIKYLNKGFSFSQAYIPDKKFFDEISSLIDKNRGKTYLHCSFGLHRTSFGIAMYEKFKNKNESDIIQNFLKYGFYDSKNRDFSSSKLNNLNKIILSFVDRFFPSHTETVRKILNTKQ